MESLHVAFSSGTHVPVQAAASASYILEIAFYNQFTLCISNCNFGLQQMSGVNFD